jgi:outer membrane scaffolding protein for murein synthesis (MipA/OmpV family)
MRGWIKTIKGMLTGVVLVCMIANFAGAQEDNLPLVPLPSVLDFTRGKGWGVALGVGVEYESAYDGSDEYEFEIEPAGAIQYRIGNHLFFWEGYELGWRSRLADNWLVQLNARYEIGRESDDSDDDRLDGLEDQDDEIGGRVMSGDSSFGTLVIIAAGYRFGSQLNGTGTELSAFSTFGTSDFINRDFGVTEKESLASGLPATDLSGGYRSTGISLVDRRYLTDHFHIISRAGFELYSNKIQDSPIARKDYEAEVSLAVVYHF